MRVPEDLISLRAGPLALWWQPEDGMLRHVSAGGREGLRGITASVRDRSWGTFGGRPDEVTLRRDEQTFALRYSIRCAAGDIDYLWQAEIRGTETGVVTYEFRGQACSDFAANRIGLCVLHPGGLAGTDVEVEHTDGSRETGRLPEAISPWQPFFEVRALTVGVAPGMRLEVRMQGDVFEMEDQRNWLDDSFKAYCPPLARPWPFAVKANDRVEQRVTLRLLDAPPVADAPAPDVPELSFPRGSAWPALGVAWSLGDRRPLSHEERVRLAAIPLAHLRIDVVPGEPESMRAAEIGFEEARVRGVPVEIALHINETNAAAAEAWVRGCREHVARWIVVERGRNAVTSRRWPDALRSWKTDEAPVVAGSDVQFAELNRERPPAEGLDGVAFGFSPQVHAFDERSMLETLVTIPRVVTQARSFVGGRPAHLGVITLRPAGRRTSEEDPRLATQLGARWTRGAIDALASAEAASATFYTVRGVIGAPDVAALFSAGVKRG